jgi:WD40 repeat protein
LRKSKGETINRLILLAWCAAFVGCEPASGDKGGQAENVEEPKEGKKAGKDDGDTVRLPPGFTKEQEERYREQGPPKRRPWHVSVHEAALSPDGRYALLGYKTNRYMYSQLKLWDAKAGKEIKALKGHTGEVNWVGFLPDGKRALSGDIDGNLNLYATPSGRLIWSTRAHMAQFKGTISADGKLVLTWSRQLKLWDVAKGRLRRTFAAKPKGCKHFLALSPDNQLACATSGWHRGLRKAIQMANLRRPSASHLGTVQAHQIRLAFSLPISVEKIAGTMLDCTGE